MKLFQRKEYGTPEEKKLSLLRFWLFVIGVFSFVGSFAFLYVANMARTGAFLWAFALRPSLTIFVVVAVILVIVYFAYRAVVMRSKS